MRTETEVRLLCIECPVAVTVLEGQTAWHHGHAMVPASEREAARAKLVQRRIKRSWRARTHA
jgi:hypothetical protein